MNRLRYDGNKSYLWEAQGWLCGVTTAAGNHYQYFYDAQGHRVTTASRSDASCGFGTTTLADFVPSSLDDQAGHQTVEIDANLHWKHTNVYANGELLATYDPAGLHYALPDWLGDKRVQASWTGAYELSCWNFPFNDGFGCTGTDATEHRYTGKEHDPYTGLDLFGAREYTGYSGRFLSPDFSTFPRAVPYAVLSNPQSLNLYSYVKNNPLSSVDKDGHADWLEQVKQWLTSSHQASASASATADQATERNGGLSATAKAGTAQASASASYGTNTSVAAKASATVAGVTINEVSNSTTAVNGLTANAGANAGVGLGGKAGVGVSAGASANADVLTGSQTETVTIGSVTVTGTATGNVGIGANASFSLGTGGISASAGVTPGFGGALSFGISWGGDTVSGGASVKGTIDQTTTKINTPQVTPN